MRSPFSTGEPWLIELAARSIGGLCARTSDSARVLYLEDLILRQAVGHHRGTCPIKIRRRRDDDSCSGILQDPRDWKKQGASRELWKQTVTARCGRRP